mmetsp:Transcript_16611/g.30212  ORF Transcript_16611/g.30212 Transcript_16611/m.30212 type:complete len:210 (-) Transcript_16611:2001-2630(-)
MKRTSRTKTSSQCAARQSAARTRCRTKKTKTASCGSLPTAGPWIAGRAKRRTAAIRWTFQTIDLVERLPSTLATVTPRTTGAIPWNCRMRKWSSSVLPQNSVKPPARLLFSEWRTLCNPCKITNRMPASTERPLKNSPKFPGNGTERGRMPLSLKVESRRLSKACGVTWITWRSRLLPCEHFGLCLPPITCKSQMRPCQKKMPRALSMP